jgi:hypothetical protein
MRTLVRKAFLSLRYRKLTFYNIIALWPGSMNYDANPWGPLQD